MKKTASKTRRRGLSSRRARGKVAWSDALLITPPVPLWSAVCSSGPLVTLGRSGPQESDPSHRDMQIIAPVLAKCCVKHGL